MDKQRIFKLCSLLLWASMTLMGTSVFGQTPQGAPEVPVAPRPDEEDEEVPFVPTPDEIVAEMLRLANVTKNDVVYDLGCGDGRIVIAAAQRYGARGVGVDIDPQRIKESKENARKAGVTERVKFIEQDLFKAHLGDATVVTLFLLPEVNLRLRPKLLRELKPGTRIVSHSFDMGDWKPEKVSSMQGTYGSIYLWVVPPGATSKD